MKLPTLNQDWKARTPQLLWAVGGALMLLVVVVGIQRKNDAYTDNLVVEIADLPSGNLIKESDVRTLLQESFLQPFEGVPVEEVDVMRIERVLRRDPFIRNAEAYLDAQDHLHIEVEQRNPIVRIMDATGQQYYLDVEGNKIPLSKHYTARVPVASGSVPPYTVTYRDRKAHPLKDIYQLSLTLLRDPFMWALVEQIYIGDDYKITLVPKLGQQKILLGTIADLEDKLERLRIFYEEAMPHQGWQKYRELDLRFKGQVVGRK